MNATEANSRNTQHATCFTGTVKWFSSQRGYGFISPADADPGTPDIFVHIKEIHLSGIKSPGAGLDYLNTGDIVGYDIVQSRGKPAAANLKVVTRVLKSPVNSRGDYRIRD